MPSMLVVRVNGFMVVRIDRFIMVMSRRLMVVKVAMSWLFLMMVTRLGRLLIVARLSWFFMMVVARLGRLFVMDITRCHVHGKASSVVVMLSHISCNNICLSAKCHANKTERF